MSKRPFAHSNHSSHGERVIPVFLPKNPDGSRGGFYNIHSNILEGVRSLFENIEGLVLEPGMKFCRNYAKSGKESRNKQIRVLQIRPEGSPIFHGSIANEDLNLKHSIFIHKTPEQLNSSQALNTRLAGDDRDLGVWLLCESTLANTIGIGYRNRNRHIDTKDERLVANCVIKYMLYLGTVADFKKTTELNFTPFENPRWAVYKRRVHNYIFVHQGKTPKSRGISIRKFDENTIIRWQQNGTMLRQCIKNEAIKKAPDLERLLSSDKQESTCPKVLKEIKSIAGITGESDFSTFEVMPYLGPSLFDIAEESQVKLFQKITMCIAFFEHIASEYERYKRENPEPSTLGFYDIKPDNFSFDIHGTKECVQNDTKAKNRRPEMRTKYYTAPWVFEYNGSLNQQKSIPARDLYAMGKSVMNILQLHQNQKYRKKSERLEKLQILFLEKMANDIMSHATANQDNKDLDNAAYIRATVIPSLKDAYVSDDILFSSAVNYVKEKHTPIDDKKKEAIKANSKKKNIFTCAVFGAKAYLDQHQMKNDKTTGKDAVNKFLEDLVSIESNLDEDFYKKDVEDKIEASKKGSNSFSKRSRHNIFNAYSPPSFIRQNQTDHIREATEERIYNLVTLDNSQFCRARDIFLLNDSQNLRFKVLEKAIQYLECSKAGWLGKRAVRGLIKTLSEDETIKDDFIIEEVKLTVNACVFFKGINKTRTAFFGDFFPSERDEQQQQPQSPVVGASY